VTGPIRITGPLLDVLEVFLRALDEQVQPHGWAIMKATRRSGPTVYGVLDRLEQGGWIVSRWERHHPEPNKPRRRFYRLTPTGAVAARDLITARRPEALRRSVSPASGRPGLGGPVLGGPELGGAGLGGAT